MKTLVVGWFSFEKTMITAGDLEARNLACKWLESIGHSYDIALAPPFSGGVNWRLVDPSNYSHVVFVCGPFHYYDATAEFLHRFDSCRLIGLDLSMIKPIDVWNPFDVLIERDSSAHSRPDISFLSYQKPVPVVGILLVHPQPEYGDKGRHQVVNDAVYRLIDSQEMAAVPIDTCLDPNTTNLRNAAEIESLIARMDLVITTRLHGTVFAIKNGVPAIVIDPILGGAKVLRHAQTIGWSSILTTDNLTDEALQKAFAYCQTEAARVKAKECRERAIKVVEKIGDEFIAAMSVSGRSNSRVDWPYEVEYPVVKAPSPPPTPIKKMVLSVKSLLRPGKQALQRAVKPFLK